jgi:hypothetical protein
VCLFSGRRSKGWRNGTPDTFFFKSKIYHPSFCAQASISLGTLRRLRNGEISVDESTSRQRTQTPIAEVAVDWDVGEPCSGARETGEALSIDWNCGEVSSGVLVASDEVGRVSSVVDWGSVDPACVTAGTNAGAQGAEMCLVPCKYSISIHCGWDRLEYMH